MRKMMIVIGVPVTLAAFIVGTWSITIGNVGWGVADFACGALSGMMTFWWIKEG